MIQQSIILVFWNVHLHNVGDYCNRRFLQERCCRDVPESSFPVKARVRVLVDLTYPPIRYWISTLVSDNCRGGQGDGYGLESDYSPQFLSSSG